MNQSDPFADLKKRQRELWVSFTPTATFTTPVAAHLVKFAGIAAGEHVLDVATGTGVVAITAARAGAQVTGLDMTPALLEQARKMRASRRQQNRLDGETPSSCHAGRIVRRRPGNSVTCSRRGRDRDVPSPGARPMDAWRLRHGRPSTSSGKSWRSSAVIHRRPAGPPRRRTGDSGDHRRRAGRQLRRSVGRGGSGRAGAQRGALSAVHGNVDRRAASPWRRWPATASSRPSEPNSRR